MDQPSKVKRILQSVFSFLGIGKLKMYRLTVIQVLNKVKDIVNNPLMDIAVHLTTFTDLDDKGLAWVRKALPKILKKLGYTRRISYEGAVADTADYIRECDPAHRPTLYRRIAGELYNVKAKLPIDIAIEEVQREYKATSVEAPISS